MRFDYIAIAFGYVDGTLISQQQFWKEHADVDLSKHEKRRLLDNLEVQATKFLEQNWQNRHSRVRLDGQCSSFTFRDPESGELYFKPLYEIDIRVFFKKMNQAYVLVYDLRRVT